MQILKERAMRSYHVCRFTAIAGLAVAITAVCASPSFAKHHHNNNATPTTVAETTTTTVGPNGAMQTTTVATDVGAIDYRILADPDMDHFAIKRAKSYGLTDVQIAQCAKLAHYAMEPMSRIVSQVEDGYTISNLAMQYGVSLDTIGDASDWQDRINNYMTAWDNTGMGALRHPWAEPVVSSYSTITPAVPEGTAIEPNGATISPNGTTVEPNGATVAPNGTTVTPNGATIAPNGTTVSPGGTTTSPNGTVVSPGGTTVAPNGTTTTPEGTTTTPSGTTIPPTSQ